LDYKFLSLKYFKYSAIKFNSLNKIKKDFSDGKQKVSSTSLVIKAVAK